MEFSDNPEVQKILQQQSDPFFDSSNADFSTAALTKAESADTTNQEKDEKLENDEKPDNFLKIKRSNTGLKTDSVGQSIDLTDLGPN